MAMLTIRNLPDDVHRALRVRAAQHGQSTEAEVRVILANAVMPQTRVRLGDAPDRHCAIGKDYVGNFYPLRCASVYYESIIRALIGLRQNSA